MAYILKELMVKYCISREEASLLLKYKYNFDVLSDDCIIEDEQAEYLIDTIYGKIENDVDLHYDPDELTDEEIADLLYEASKEYEDYKEDLLGVSNGNEDIINPDDCPPKSQLTFAHGSLLCPCCGRDGTIFADGTAYCGNCNKWYCYT